MHDTISAHACAHLTLLAALAALALPDAALAACKYRRTVSIPVSWKAGLPHIDGSINDTPVEMIVDTGTSGVLLPSGLADELQLPQRRNDAVWVGPEGRTQGYDARIRDVAFGPVRWHNTTLPVNLNPKGRTVQVGGTFLLQDDLEMSAERITFFQADGCGDEPLAYWAAGVPWTAMEEWGNERRIFITVQIDGKPVRALVDSGSPVSRLDLPAARRLGFDEHGAGVTAVPGHDSWVATFDTFTIDEETVRHPHLVVADVWGGRRKAALGIVEAKEAADEPPLLLGADFLKAHRVLFARSQHRMYLSYVGGPLFGLPTQEAAGPAH
ncbi:MAG TPA: retroviral-like aspartic protease family protein [Burkholderiaceae bacterium]